MTNHEHEKSKQLPQKLDDPALKQRALDLLNTSGLSIKKVALTVGVSLETLRRWKAEQNEKIRCEKAYEEELARADGWKYELTDRTLSGRCATTPPYPNWSEIGRNFIAIMGFALWTISLVVMLLGIFTIVSPFVLPTGHNESFGNWAWLVTFLKMFIAFTAVALGVAASMWLINPDRMAISPGVIGVTVIPGISFTIGSEGTFGGFLAIMAIINLSILALAITLWVVTAIRMLFHKLVISYEFNADMGTLKCTKESLLRTCTQHAIPFASLSSIQIHLNEQYAYTPIDECRKFRGHIICIEMNGNKFGIAGLRDDLHERTLRAHEDWLRNILGNDRVEVHHHYLPAG